MVINNCVGVYEIKGKMVGILLDALDKVDDVTERYFDIDLDGKREYVDGKRLKHVVSMTDDGYQNLEHVGSSFSARPYPLTAVSNAVEVYSVLESRNLAASLFHKVTGQRFQKRGSIVLDDCGIARPYLSLDVLARNTE